VIPLSFYHSASFFLIFVLSDLSGFDCGHVFCQACSSKLTKKVCPLDNQPITATHHAPYLALKISGLKMRCPNFKRGCKVEMLAGKEFQTVQKHVRVRFFKTRTIGVILILLPPSSRLGM
jgi:hypothetical protein